VPLAKGYPQSNGAKRESVITKAGPTSYTQVTPGNPPTGGQSVEAVEFGLKYIEHVIGGLSDNGQYEVRLAAGIADPVGVKTYVMQWCGASSGAEAAGGTNFSGRTVRLRAIGL
jgi:hypothetical protein